MNPPTQPKALLIDNPISRGQVAALAEELSLHRAEDCPWTNGIRHTTWRGQDIELTFAAYAPSGKGLFLVAELPEGKVAELIADRFEAKTIEAVIEEAKGATRLVDVVKALHTVSTFMLPTHGPRDVAVAYICEGLLDDRQLVRWAASRILRWQARPDVEKAYAAAAKEYPELGAVAATVHENCQAAEDGTLHDGPTDSWWELVRRARQGVADEKWKRVEKATEMLLDESLDHAEGLLLRGLAYEAAHAPVLALGLVGASAGVQQTEREVRDEDEKDEKAAKLQRETEAVQSRLQPAVSSLAPNERDEAARVVLGWLERFRDDDRTNAAAGMARALCDHVPGLGPLLHYVAGSYSNDAPLLERALAAAPDSPTCVAAMGHALRKEDAARAEALFREAMSLAEYSDSRSEAAARIESYPRVRDKTTKASMLDELANMAYKRHDWDEAGKLGDALVEADPDTTVGWQIRANARTFALRHEEAVPLYEQALKELTRILDDDDDSIMFGDDPRPGVHFNLSCVLAKLGKREASLDQLRQAVREDDKFCEQAVEDDYYGELLEDPEFKAIVEQEPRALVLEEELERGFVERIASRALGLSHRGDVDEAIEVAERAAELAEIGEHPDLLIRALSVHGRTLAFEGDAGPGLELLERAVGLAKDEGIEDELRAETTHTYGFVLHAAEQTEQAEKVYQQALELRKKAYGEDHPVVAKSYGDIARLVADEGRVDEARALMTQGAELLDRYLKGEPHDEDARIEALVDQGTLLSNLAHLTDQAGEGARALEQMERAVDAVESVFDEGYTAGEAFLSYASNLADRLVQNAETEDDVEVARALANRLAGLGQSDDPVIRAEQAFWRGLRRFAVRMKRVGVTDEVLAQAFTNALRGGSELPPELRSVPELGGLANELAQRAAHNSTFIIMAPMALQTAAAGGSIDEALEQLEGICVAALMEEPS